MTPDWNEILPTLDTLRVGFPVAEAQAVLDHPELQVEGAETVYVA